MESVLTRVILSERQLKRHRECPQTPKLSIRHQSWSFGHIVIGRFSRPTLEAELELNRYREYRCSMQRLRKQCIRNWSWILVNKKFPPFTPPLHLYTDIVWTSTFTCIVKVNVQLKRPQKVWIWHNSQSFLFYFRYPVLAPSLVVPPVPLWVGMTIDLNYIKSDTINHSDPKICLFHTNIARFRFIYTYLFIAHTLKGVLPSLWFSLHCKYCWNLSLVLREYAKHTFIFIYINKSFERVY